MAELNEDDDVVINTLSQTEAVQNLAAKKEKLNGKKNLKKEKLGVKKLLKEKRLAKSKKTIAGKKSAEESSGKINMDLETADVADSGEKQPKKTWDKPGVEHTGSKNAKFSSLFKNNHEIPKIGE